MPENAQLPCSMSDGMCLPACYPQIFNLGSSPLFFEPIIVVWSTQSCTSDSITRRFVAVGDKPRLM